MDYVMLGTCIDYLMKKIGLVRQYGDRWNAS
jgi:hypothetical protein